MTLVRIVCRSRRSAFEALPEGGATSGMTLKFSGGTTLIGETN
jgi:hypothetical protein